jgi:DNA-binding transcriptional ArsR family regulator
VSPNPERAGKTWEPLLEAGSLARLAANIRVIATPVRVTILARLAGGSSELSDFTDLPYVRDVSRQSLHEGLKTLMEHGWVMRERLGERDPWVYALASADIARSLRLLSLALFDTDRVLRHTATMLRELVPDTLAESRRNPRYCRRCERLTGWAHEHRTKPGAAIGQADA